MNSEETKIEVNLVASVLSTGIWLGVVERKYVIAWADYLIEHTDIPPIWMIDLSVSHDYHVLDVMTLLAGIKLGADGAETCRAIYGFIDSPPVETFGDAERFAKRLYELARACVNGDWNCRLLIEADQLSDTFLFIRDGSVNWPEQQAVEQVRTFLTENRDERVRVFLDDCLRTQRRTAD